MGGKNKKHKAPGAAAVRAAVSASRAKSAEAGAAGEAQNKKPVARPPPTATASSRESRVKQGTSGRPDLGFPPLDAAALSRGRSLCTWADPRFRILYIPHPELLAPLSDRFVIDQFKVFGLVKFQQ